MMKMMSVMAAVMMLGLTACGVDAQAPEEEQVKSEQVAESKAETTALNAGAPGGGGCQSYCDGQYCWMCREQPDGRCACILF